MIKKIKQDEVAELIMQKDIPITVTFIKRTTGEERIIHCLWGVKREDAKGTGMAYDPKKKSLIVVFDTDSQSYKMIPVDGVKAIKIKTTSYLVEETGFKEAVDDMKKKVGGRDG